MVMIGTRPPLRLPHRRQADEYHGYTRNTVMGLTVACAVADRGKKLPAPEFGLYNGRLPAEYRH